MAGYYYDILQTIQEPDEVYAGKYGELLAVREVEPKKYMVVVYREVNLEDGFVITAFFTRRDSVFRRRVRVWP